jgi:hypothetical protein
MLTAPRRTPIHAEKVKYKNIIETDVTIMGCDYVGCIILVRKTYDTGSEYNFV